jgi:quinol monooxygenase YgiN
MSETMMIPWYATGFRADGLEAALNEIAAVAMHYGATSYAVYRSRDDRYRFQQFVTFESHEAWERYWEGEDMVAFRAAHSSWYQVPVLYSPWNLTAAGGLGDNGDGDYVPTLPSSSGADEDEPESVTTNGGPRVRAV